MVLAFFSLLTLVTAHREEGGQTVWYRYCTSMILLDDDDDDDDGVG